ncbi:hypothetical protein DL93DRAFT_967629 [Clavulina sp. PMI_390]|nr:hypothetical protein DL93DRAFT_967629 [Clavulina sp. PMI_390]
MAIQPPNPHLGCFFIGNLLSSSLFGLITVQAHRYYAKFPKDPWWIKTLVAFLCSSNNVSRHILTNHTVSSSIPNCPLGRNILDNPFDRILHSHPALFCPSVTGFIEPTSPYFLDRCHHCCECR